MYDVKRKTIYSGDPASFTAQSGDSIGSIIAAITPMQSGSGDPSPDNVRPITGWTGANLTRTGINFAKNVRKGTTVAGGSTKTFIFADDGSFTVTSSGGTSTTTQAIGLASTIAYPSSQSAELYALPDLFVLKAGKTYTVRDCVISVFTGGVETRAEYGNYLYLSSHRNTVVTPSSDMHVKQIRVFYRPATQYDGQFVYEPMVFEGTAADYEPFGEVYSADWTSAAGTVYAGSYDAVSGKLKARPQYASYNGETLVGPWLSSMDVYDPNGTPTTGAQVVDLGGAETVYALTPQTVTVLIGQNYVWSSINSTVNVSVLSESNFHTLSITDSPKTRCRIYFIGDGVDCTDDNDVTTNGALLVGAVGDTDSNGRIGQDGIKFTEYYNPEYNVTIGRAVSSQVEMTLLNTDGALNNFTYGRCKIYLDVYDSANSTWLSCPMGVYNIELPTRRKVQLIHAFGYDQMQKLDGICDTWWAGLNFSGGLTLLQIVQSMATQTGVIVSANTASAIVNSSVTYTAAPFDCVETTYREVLELIAEATGTVARFDRDGALELKWFDEAQIGGNTVEIDTDTIGNQCLSIDLAEYQVAAIDLLKVKIAEDDVGVTVGYGTNQYTVLDNLFLDGSVATITTRATPIYNRLNGLGTYKPIQSNLIWDWSIEAGDIIEIVRDSTTYTVPIFQQTMKWRGGYVVSDVVNSGDNVRPVPNYNERSTYRMQSEMSAKVGDNEIISKINQSPEAITIQASKVDLSGYVTFTNLSTSGQTNIDGGNITTGSISANHISGGTLVMGGNLDEKGLIHILDENNDICGIINNNGITAYKIETNWNHTLSSWFSGYSISMFDSTLNNRLVNLRSVQIDGSDEFGQLLLFGFAGGSNVSQVEISASPASNQSYISLTGGNNYVRLASDGTYKGVFDVIDRRCSAELSTTGWYRVLTYDGISLTDAYGASGRIFDFNITRSRTNTTNEVHKISLFNPYNVFKFDNETSNSNALLIDKIRVSVNETTYKTFVDIHYAGTSANFVTVEFVMHGHPTTQSRCIASNLISVSGSPSGETVLPEHDFIATGHNFTMPIYMNGTLIHS